VKWGTRPGVHVDRAACAWLIRRFIDPGPEFVFAADLAAVPADVTPFEHARSCTRATTRAGARRNRDGLYDLADDPALEEIAHIVTKTIRRALRRTAAQASTCSSAA